MQLTKREWHWERWRGLGGAVAIGAVLGILGPFGSQTTMRTGVKYAFWMVLALAGYAAAAAARRLLAGVLESRALVVRLAAVAAASAVPMSFVVAWMMGLVRPGRTLGPAELAGLYPFVALVQLVLARAALSAPPAPAETTRAEASPVAYPPELLGKLPPALRSGIVALEAEDHYLRVHTRQGSALILMRLADAAAMIDLRLGLRVHRSWWVAKDGAEAFETTAGRAAIRLASGTRVPVSRTYLPSVRAALGG